MIKATSSFFSRYWDLFLLFGFALAYILIFSNLSVLRHNAFASGFDLANMNQTVWNTLHGRPFELSGIDSTISRFSIHADLILVLLSPIYAIWQRATTLLIIQSILLGLGAIPVYFLAKNILNNKARFGILQSKISSLVLVLVYLLNPGMEWANIYDFHGVCLAIPFLLSAFYFAYKKQWLGYAVFVFFALLTKEEISLFIAMLGLIIFFVFKNKKIGLITFTFSVVYFLIMILLVIPYFSENGKYWAFDWFSLTNGTTQEFSLLQKIDKFTLSQDAISYYLSLLKPFGFLPLLGLPWLILSLPELLINLLSSQAQMRSIYFHYDSGIIPALVISSVFAFKYINLILIEIYSKILSKLEKKLYKLTFYFFLGVILIFALRFNYHYSPFPTTPSCWCIVYQVTNEDKDFAKVLAAIPQSASVTSSSEIRAHLTKRENSFNLPSATDSAQYVAILDQNRIVGDYSPKEFENALLKEPVFLKTHDLISHIGHFYLFKKK